MIANNSEIRTEARNSRGFLKKRNGFPWFLRVFKGFSLGLLVE